MTPNSALLIKYHLPPASSRSERLSYPLLVLVAGFSTPIGLPGCLVDADIDQLGLHGGAVALGRRALGDSQDCDQARWIWDVCRHAESLGQGAREEEDDTQTIARDARC